MAKRQTERPVLVDLANSLKHVKGGTGVDSEKYKGVLASPLAVGGGAARPRPLCGLCWGSTLDDAPDVSSPTSLASRPHTCRGLHVTKYHLLPEHKVCVYTAVALEIWNIRWAMSYGLYGG